MWSSRAPVAGGLLGIGGTWPALEIQYESEFATRGDFLSEGFDGIAGLKHPVIQAFVGDRPYFYADDDITPELLSWAARRDERIPTLYVRPDPQVGLELEHLDELRAFAERVRVWRQESGGSPTSPTSA